MNALIVSILTRLQALNYRVNGIPPRLPGLTPVATGQAASDIIRDRLLAQSPCMICRFGRTELETVCRYLDVSSTNTFAQKSLAFIRHEIGPFWWDDAA